MSGPGLMSAVMTPPTGVLSSLPAQPQNAPPDQALGMLAQIMMGGPIGQVAPSPLTQAVSGGAQTLLGNPSQYVGALSAAQQARDTAAADKMAAIQRATNILSAIPRTNPQLQHLAIGAGMLAPDRSGSVFEALGGGAASYGQELTREQTAGRQNALDVLNLALAHATVPEQTAEANAAGQAQRLGLGERLGQEAMMAQYRDDIGRARLTTPFVNASARVTAAQISGNKGRHEYLGPADQQEYPGKGWYLDRTNNQLSLGPLIGPKPSAARGVTPDAALGQARKDYEAYRKQDIQNGGTGTVYNADHSIADPATWISDRAHQYQQRGGTSTAPAAGTGAVPATPIGGRQNPMRFSGSDADQKAAFARLRSGDWFYNPADGRLLQKK